MKRPRIRLRCIIPSVLILLPMLCWLLILGITPTEWARAKIIAKLGKSTGRTIHLAKLRVGTFGGVHLEGLEIGAPGSNRDPWLRVSSVRINVSALQMLSGQLEPNEVEVDGLQLRVLRRQDGSLELADLLRPIAIDPSKTDDSACDIGELVVRLRGGTVTVIDESSKTRLTLSDVEGHASWHGRHASVPEFRGSINGGTFDITASWDRTKPECAYEAKFQVKDLALDDGTNSLIYLIPILSGLPNAKSLEGRLSTTVYLRGAGTSREALKRTLVGQGSIKLDPITLDGSRLLDDIADVIALPPKDRVGVVTSDFMVRNGRILTDNLTIDVAKIPIVLTGWTDFDTNLDYRLRADLLGARLSNKARDFLEDFAIDVAREASIFHVTGTLDAMRVTVDGPPSDRQAKGGDPTQQRLMERQRLREVGRRYRDRLFR